MTPDEIKTLVPAFSGFHQDFNLDDLSERDVLVMHARGIDPPMRDTLYAALEALLRETSGVSDSQFNDACWKTGAHSAPSRAELESFVAWARTAEGAAEIDAPGPTSSYIVVRADLTPG